MFFHPHIQKADLPCPRLPPEFDGLRILHLSDLHITSWTQKLTIWTKLLPSLRADIVLITGDLGHRSWLWKRSLTNVERFLTPLAPRLGTYFILGNHDSAKLGAALARTLDKSGLPRVLLKNQAVFLPAPNSPALSLEPTTAPRLALVGIHQHRRIDTDIPTAMRLVRPTDFVLMLLHYPDLVFPAMAAGADICLAGHTHGGQICWPDGRPLFRQDTLPALQCTGLHRIEHARGQTWMIVNRGIGVAGLRVRMFCPPEALLLTLRSAAPTR